jgi:hypothetical protein
MGMIIDIRKYSLDQPLSSIHEAAKIKKGLFKKAKDNYWPYLEDNMSQISCELNTFIIADFLTYLDQVKNFKTVLESDSNRLSQSRGTGVVLFNNEDSEEIRKIISEPNFDIDLLKYAEELNGEYFDYSEIEMKENVSEFLKAISEANAEYGVLVNIG